MHVCITKSVRELSSTQYVDISCCTCNMSILHFIMRGSVHSTTVTHDSHDSNELFRSNLIQVNSQTIFNIFISVSGGAIHICKLQINTYTRVSVHILETSTLLIKYTKHNRITSESNFCCLWSFAFRLHKKVKQTYIQCVQKIYNYAGVHYHNIQSVSPIAASIYV